MQVKQLIAALALGIAFVVPAHAAQIFSSADISGGLVQNFDDAGSYDTSGSRVQIGNSLGVDLGLSSAGGPSIFSAPAWTLSGNGEWSLGKTFVGVDGAFQDEASGIAASLFFDFGAKTVQSVGAFLNYDPSFTYGLGFPLPLYIAAYDALGALIEDAWINIDTPNALNDGLFFGLDVGSAIISKFEISAPYAVVDDFTFSNPVPEPESLALLLAGLGILGAVSRKRCTV